MTPPVVEQAEDCGESFVESQRKTVKQVKQKQQEHRKSRDLNGNIIKEKAKNRISISSRLRDLLRRALNKKPNFRPCRRRASYSFNGFSKQTEKEPVKSIWWTSKSNEEGRQRQLSTEIANNGEFKEEDIPVRHRSADCL